MTWKLRDGKQAGETAATEGETANFKSDLGATARSSLVASSGGAAVSFVKNTKHDPSSDFV